MTKFVASEITTLSKSSYQFMTDTALKVLADGGWIVTWVETKGSPESLHMLRFDANGVAVGGEQDLGQLSSPAVSALSDGGWIVTGWAYDETTNTSEEVAWRFDASGARVELDEAMDGGSEWLAGLPDGGWVGLDLQQTDDHWNLVQQRYGSNGQAVGSGVTLSTAASPGPDQNQVTVLEDGDWVTTWIEGDTRYQQYFTSDGVATGEAAAYPAGPWSVDPTITATPDGGWLILYKEERQWNLLRFDTDGAQVGDATAIDTVSYRRTPQALAVLSDGGWAIVWSGSTDSREHHENTVMQVYGADGTTMGRPYVVSDRVSYDAKIEVLDDGAIVVMWEKRLTGAVMQRVYRPADDIDPPHSIDDAGQMKEHDRLTVDVLKNDIVADEGDVLTLESASLASGKGSVKFTDNGKVTVRDLHGRGDLVTGQTEEIVVKYTISDGFETATGKLVVTVNGVTEDGETVKGTSGADQYKGIEDREIYYGFGGDDRVDGRGGNDRLFGGNGDDRLDGGSGTDILVGGKGDDILIGGGDMDEFVIQRGDGRDRIINHGYGFVDLTDFHFKSLDALSKLVSVKGDDLFVDLPGGGHLRIDDGLYYISFDI